MSHPMATIATPNVKKSEGVANVQRWYSEYIKSIRVRGIASTPLAHA